MVRWKKRIRKTVYLTIDVITIILVYVLSCILYCNFYSAASLPNPFDNVACLSIIIFIMPAMFTVMGIYTETIEQKKTFSIILFIKTSILIVTNIIFLAAILYFVKEHTVSRLLISIFGVCLFVALFIQRLILKNVYRMVSGKGEKAKNIIVVGNSQRGEKYIQYIKAHDYLNMRLVGYVHIKKPVLYEGLNHLGELENLVSIAKEYVIDEVVVARSNEYDERLQSILNQCEQMGLTVTMLLECNHHTGTKAHVAMVGDIPTIKFHTVSLNENQILAKRMLDMIGSLVGMVFFGIAYVIIGPLIKLETPGPIIFKQKRVGKNGRIFEIWKFRSMGVNAEKQKAALMSNNEMNTGHMFKIQQDPRITKIGTFIRKTSIDELPQFWNVLRGDMSLVGTRPPLVEEVKRYELHHHKRMSITPGITGKWQVSGRSNILDFEEVVKLDIDYIQNWSIWLDIKILLQTVVSVVKKKGAK